MQPRLKKAIGTVITVVFLTIYCLLAMVLAVRILPGTSGFIQLIYYVVAGLLWVIPIGVVVKWMQKPAA